MTFKVFDTKYANRLYMLGDMEVQFAHRVAEVTPAAAYRMSRRGDGEFFIEDKRLPFNPDSWTRDKRLIWACNMSAANGFGMVAENTIAALMRAGIHVANPKSVSGSLVSGGEYIDPAVRASLQTSIDPDCIEIQHCQPPAFKTGVVERSWMYTMFETNHTPKRWIKMLNQAERVLVPSAWLVESWREQGVTRPIDVYGHGIDPTTYYDLDRPERETYTFLHYGQLSLRKGTDLVFRAFTEEFKPYEDARLILKNTFPLFPVPLGAPNVEYLHVTYSKEQMRALLKRADCFVFPTRGEGFGLPPFEAMACFTADTEVTSETTIAKAHKRFYEGDMLSIRAGDTVITCTPNHPILTSKGWKSAQDVGIMDSVYIKQATNYDRNKVEARRIDDIEAKLPAVEEGTSPADTSQDNGRDWLSSQTIAISEDFKGLPQTDEREANARGVGLPSRYRGRGGNPHVSQIGRSREDSSISAGGFYGYEADRLAQDKAKYQYKFMGGCTSSTRQIADSIHLLFERLSDASVTRTLAALSLAERQALWNFDYLHKDQTSIALRRSLRQRRIELLTSHPGVECQRITSIERHPFTGYVYNLTTADGTYYANGVLVHNCGLPTIVTNWSGPVDFIDPADTLPLSYRMSRAIEFDQIYADFFETGENAGDWAEPDLADLRAKMRWCYEHRSEARTMGKRAAARLAREWTWDAKVRELVQTIDANL